MDINEFREKLKEKCKKCEFYGRKFDSYPYWEPCKIMAKKVENCIFHYIANKEWQYKNKKG